jgi:pimeloyl-ACP methyl ester carboxylesterase
MHKRCSIAPIGAMFLVLMVVLVITFIQKCEGTLMKPYYAKATNGRPLVVKTKSIELYTESFGTSANPAVLLIAGTMTSAHCWLDAFCQQLADAGYFVIRYDHRDTGLSSAIDYAKVPYVMADLVNDAVAILDAYHIQKAHIVGESMGGAIAQMMALDHADRVLSIAPISSMVLAPAEFTDEEKAVHARVFPVIMNNRPNQNYEESRTRLLTAYDSFHGDIPVDKGIAEGYIKDIYTRTKPVYLERLGAGVMHGHVLAHHSIVDRTKELAAVRVPVCFIHGQKDCLIPLRVVQVYGANHYAHATVQVVPGMGHMVLSRSLFETIGKLLITQFALVKAA